MKKKKIILSIIIVSLSLVCCAIGVLGIINSLYKIKTNIQIPETSVYTYSIGEEDFSAGHKFSSGEGEVLFNEECVILDKLYCADEVNLNFAIKNQGNKEVDVAVSMAITGDLSPLIEIKIDDILVTEENKSEVTVLREIKQDTAVVIPISIKILLVKNYEEFISKGCDVDFGFLVKNKKQDASYTKQVKITDFQGSNATLIETTDELSTAIETGGYVVLNNDIKLKDVSESQLGYFVIQSGVDLTLDMNGKTITIPDNHNAACLFENKYGASLTITGNGTFKMGSPTENFMALFAPRGNLTIMNGNFVYDYYRDDDEKPLSNSNYATMFIGINVKNPSEEVYSNIKIYGGYFDGGYYRTDEYVSYNTSGCAGIDSVINASNNQNIKVYGGTFVFCNPAWGDEGCANVYRQGETKKVGVCTFLEGQEIDDLEIPNNYTINESVLNDGTNRPVYTVVYNG